MRKTSLPYLQFVKRGQRTYVYFRKGSVRRRLPDNMDSKEFSDAYWDCRSGKAKAQCRHSWNDLIISYYRSPGFAKLADGTKTNYRRHCEEIREKNGSKDMRTFRRKHAIDARDKLAASWSKANERVAVLSMLCRHAVDLEWIDRNPVVDIEKLKGGEYQPWPEEKLRAFEIYCEKTGNSLARTAYEIAVGTGQRIGDCCAMAWDDFDGEFMNVVQEKTGAKISVYCPQRLRDYLANLPKRGRHILARNLTQPIGKRAVQKAVEDVRNGIGVLSGKGRLVIHGWRYTAAVRLAEAGCSDAEIQSVTGHRTLAMVQKYRGAANQKRTSRQAQTRVEQNRNGS